MGRESKPGAVIVDSPSVKTTEKGWVHGCDGAKKVNGRKRHILVDTTGLLMKVAVHSAEVSEGDSAKTWIKALRFSFLKSHWCRLKRRKPGIENGFIHIGDVKISLNLPED